MYSNKYQTSLWLGITKRIKTASFYFWDFFQAAFFCFLLQLVARAVESCFPPKFCVSALFWSKGQEHNRQPLHRWPSLRFKQNSQGPSFFLLLGLLANLKADLYDFIIMMEVSSLIFRLGQINQLMTNSNKKVILWSALIDFSFCQPICNSIV